MWETKSHSFSEFTFELKFAFRMVLLYHTWGAYILQQGKYISNFLVLFWMHYFVTNNQYWAFPYYILLFFSGQWNKNHNFLSVIEWVASALVYVLLLSKVDVRGHSQTMLTKICPFLTTYLPLHMCPVWHLWRNSFTVIRGKCAYRWHFQDHLSTSSCKRSLWTSH